MNDRRRHERTGYCRAINYSDGECLFQGTIDNISVGGMFIHTDQGAHSGTVLRLYVGLPKHDTAVDGIVVRREETGIGVAFNEEYSLESLVVAEDHQMWG